MRRFIFRHPDSQPWCAAFANPCAIDNLDLRPTGLARRLEAAEARCRELAHERDGYRNDLIAAAKERDALLNTPLSSLLSTTGSALHEERRLHAQTRESALSAIEERNDALSTLEVCERERDYAKRRWEETGIELAQTAINLRDAEARAAVAEDALRDLEAKHHERGVRIGELVAAITRIHTTATTPRDTRATRLKTIADEANTAVGFRAPLRWRLVCLTADDAGNLTGHITRQG